MSNQTIRVPRATDRAVIETFTELAKKYSVPSINGSALAFANLGEYQVAEDPPAAWQQVIDLDSEILHNISIGIGGQSISYVRGGVRDDAKSAIYDEFSFSDQQKFPVEKKLEIVAFIQRRHLKFNPDRVLPGQDMEAQREALAIHNATLERLEAVGATIAEQTLTIRSDLERLYQEKIQARTAELDADRERQKEEHNSRMSELDQKKASLEAQLKSVDDRSNTHARREIRDKMLDEVKQRVTQFDVSESTRHKRRPVGFAMVMLISFITAMLVLSVTEIYRFDIRTEQVLTALSDSVRPGVSGKAPLEQPNPALVNFLVDRSQIYWLWARSGFLLIGLVAAFLYYIKWQDKWAERHATAELQLRQFEIDISRANWVLESCLEWKKEIKDVIPSILLDRISHGVFVSGSEPAPVLHPADELASALLGSASKVKLRVGDSELDFDKPGKIPKSA